MFGAKVDMFGPLFDGKTCLSAQCVGSAMSGCGVKKAGWQRRRLRRRLTRRQGKRMTAHHVWPGACMSSRNRWNLQRFPAHASEREIEDGWPYQRPPCISDGLEMLEDAWTLCRPGQAALKRRCAIGSVHCSPEGQAVIFSLVFMHA
jgi:hypothetical protein